ncbi:hypothetical protein MY11210_004975 [Beauveria gryllotalpidicola]
MSGAAAVFTPGSTALITGGASGVGLAVAKLCHTKGMNVLLVDRNSNALEQARLQIAGEGVDASGPRVVTSVADVSLSEDWAALKDSALAKFGSVEFLALNAGILETNLFGVINGVNTFLPVVQEASKTKRTAIVITGSKQGITNPPGNAAYNASKSAVKTLAEHLSWDLRETATSVHLLVPGWTFTGRTGGGQTKEKPAGAWAPEQVADFLYKKMDNSEFYVICPDNDVSEETDKKRMLWGVGDIVHGRPPLTRWRDEWKHEAEKTMSETKI